MISQRRHFCNKKNAFLVKKIAKIKYKIQVRLFSNKLNNNNNNQRFNRKLKNKYNCYKNLQMINRKIKNKK